MEWQDEAIVLSVRRHGEGAAVASLFTRHHGRHVGLVRRGFSRRLAGVLLPGNVVSARWRARLAEQLGQFQLEADRGFAAVALDEPARLAALASLTALLEAALPERAPHPELFEASTLVLGSLFETESWPALYVRWELGLLAELGFGLDLTVCAASGMARDLAYVSPRSGRAVSAEAGAPYAARLLALPAFLAGARAAPPANDPGRDLEDGFTLTGYFLGRAFGVEGGALPPARQRLIERLGHEGRLASFLSSAPPGGVEP